MGEEILCAECGRSLPLDERPGEVSPCPGCGATTRNINLQVDPAVVGISAPAPKVHVIAEVSAVLVQGLIIPGERTDEGQLIRAVAPAWFEIIRIVSNDPKAIFRIPSRKWEEIIAGAYDAAGFDEVTLTPSSADRGRDVIAVKRGIGQVRIIDQVKAYAPHRLVTADEVRALMGVLQTDGASKGFVTTTSDFAPTLHDDPLIKPWIPSRLDLVSGEQLLKRLRKLEDSSQGSQS